MEMSETFYGCLHLRNAMEFLENYVNLLLLSEDVKGPTNQPAEVGYCNVHS